MSFLAAIALGAATAPAQATALPMVPPSDISRREALERADRLFGLLDMNHDGSLTSAEARIEGMKLIAERSVTGTDVAPGIGGRTLAYFKRALAGDAAVTRDKFEQTMLAHFDEMDTDHDGTLTAEERQEGRRAGGNGR